MVALRPDEWKPICSSASSTVTFAWRDKAAAADRPAIPPPMTRMSALFTGSDGREPLVDDLAVLCQPNGLYNLIVIREHRSPLLLVPEGGQEIVEVAREQSRRIGGKAARQVRSANDRDTILDHALIADRALNIAASLGSEVDDDAAGPH